MLVVWKFSRFDETRRARWSRVMVSVTCFSKPRRSCSWIYEINKLLVSLNKRLNNIMLERTIEYNTNQPRLIPRQKNPTLSLRPRHKERKTKVHMAYSRAHVRHKLSHVSVTVALYLSWPLLITMPWHAPAKIKRGGHFCVLTGMWVFQNITLHRATKIRLAFHFVERNKRGSIIYSLAVWRFKPLLSAGLRFHSHLSGGLRLRNYRAVAGNHKFSSRLSVFAC